MKSLSLEKSSRIKLIMLENKRFVVRQYEVSFSMLTHVTGTDIDLAELQIEQNVSFGKALCFIDAVLNDSILITHEHLSDYERTLCEFSNNYILLPDVSDTTLIDAIQRKLSAIAGKLTDVTSVTLIDLDDQLKYRLDVFDEDDDESDLPALSEWLGDLAINSVPWWDRPDETTWDGVAKDQAELESLRNLDTESGTSMFDDVEENIRKIYKAALNGEDSSGELIEVDFANQDKKKKWTPTII